jgi:hypothetical protein
MFNKDWNKIRQPVCINRVWTNRRNGEVDKDQSYQIMGTAYDSAPNDVVIGDVNAKL